MTVLEAAYEVLREAGKQLHYGQVAEQIDRLQLRHPQSKTLGHTVRSVISTDIKNKCAASRFERVAPGVFQLREFSLVAEQSSKKPAPAKQGPISRFEKETRGTFGLHSSSASAPTAPPFRKPAPAGSSRPFKEAAFEVLKASRDKKPMHCQDIIQQALEQNLIVTEGKTPAGTMSSRLAEDIRRCERRGVRSRFVKHGLGMFGLSDWEQYALNQKVEDHNQKHQSSSDADQSSGKLVSAQPSMSFKDAAFKILRQV